MTLINFVAFVVLKILDNLFSIKALEMQITANISEISNTVQPDLTFILNVLSETRIHFS